MGNQETGAEPPESASRAPGLNPLFCGVGLAVILGIVAGSLAGDDDLLQSNLVFRAVCGGVVGSIGYGVVAALWLAWHRKTFAKLNVLGSGVEAEQAELETTARDREIAEFMGATTKALEEVERRLAELEARETGTLRRDA